MTSLHSGAKFDSKIYQVAGGLHGVGLTVVNALSEYTEVTIKRNGKTYQQLFKKGEAATELKVLNESSTETGTTVKFKPDTTIFSVKNFDSMELVERLRQLAFLNKGIKIDLDDCKENGVENKYTSSRKAFPTSWSSARHQGAAFQADNDSKGSRLNKGAARNTVRRRIQRGSPVVRQQHKDRRRGDARLRTAFCAHEVDHKLHAEEFKEARQS